MVPTLLLSSLLLFIATPLTLSTSLNDDGGINATIGANNHDVCLTTRCAFNEQESSVDCSGLGCTKWSTEDDFESSPTTVQHLSVSRNRLVSLQSLQPFGATLRTLNASRNEISSIDVDAFFLSDGLVELDLSGNLLNSDTFRGGPTSMNAFFGLTTLCRLDLSDNELGELSETDMFSSMRTTLEELNLSGNGIVLVADNALTDMVALLTLDLSRNRIHALSRRNFLGLINLRRLDLSDNHLRELPDEIFGQCSRLEVLNLRRNAIRFVSPEAFRGLHSLIDLHIDDNELPDGVSSPLPPSLRRLTLDGSAALIDVNARTLGGETAFGTPVSSLEFISIRRCPSLVTIGPGAFGRMKSLAQVQLTDNPHLIVLDSAAFEEESWIVEVEHDNEPPNKPASRMVLNLSGNALSEISERLINWTTVSAFDLSFNSWICDCRLEWLHRMDYSNNQSLNTITCHWPLRLRGQRFTVPSVRSATSISCNLTFVFRYQEAVIVVIVGLTLVFLAASLTLVVRCRHKLVAVIPCRSSPSDRGDDYRTLFDTSQTTLTLQRSAAARVEGVLVAASTNDLEADDNECTPTVVVDTDPVQRPLISPGTTRGSARYARKQHR